MSDDGASGGDAPAPGAPEANLTAARFRPGQSGNPGGRPKDLPRFRRTCRQKAWAWLELLDRQMRDPGASLGEKVAAWRAVADRGGFLPADKDKHPPFLGGLGEPVGLSDSINAGVGVLGGQMQALLATAAQRPLEAAEVAMLERLTWGLSQIEQARGRLLIAALRSPDLNKDSGAALVEAFLGRRQQP